MNKAEQQHLDALVQLGCIACYNMGHPGTPAEIHHKRAGTGLKRASHYEAIPLCPQHHRTGGYGVAIHSGIRKWVEEHGTEQDLINQCKEMLNGRS